jgi:hypothetical protein
MCEYISAFHHPVTGEILVADLRSHAKTEQKLELNPAGPYREMHYLPDGVIDCRLSQDDLDAGLTPRMCAAHVKAQWPTFAEFEAWARKTAGYAKSRARKPKPNVFLEWVKQVPGSHYAKGNVEFIGPVINSYRWWAMARLVGKRHCLYRDTTYSVTTSKHQCAVRRALVGSKKIVVLVKVPELSAQKANEEWYKAEIADARSKRDRARLDYHKARHGRRVTELQASRRSYAKLCRKYA